MIKAKPKQDRPSHDSASFVIISSPLGPLGFKTENQSVVALDFFADGTKEQTPTDLYQKNIVSALEDYFAQKTKKLSINCNPQGTPFQKRVWEALVAIPYGETRTYGELAKTLGSAPRAVGQACRRNPIPLLIPCHRIVAANHLGGYAGHQTGRMMNIKEWLLRHER